MRMSLVDAVRDVRARLRDLDASVVPVDECAALVEELAGLGKACDAARARLAARVEAAGAHAVRGFVDAEEWLAVVSGSSASTPRSWLAGRARLVISGGGRTSWA